MPCPRLFLRMQIHDGQLTPHIADRSVDLYAQNRHKKSHFFMILVMLLGARILSIMFQVVIEFQRERRLLPWQCLRRPPGEAPPPLPPLLKGRVCNGLPVRHQFLSPLEGEMPPAGGREG
ncbi:hypothetical protein APZ00_25170 (plasmid) [Pannonibacter phragmitetus]|uniref:Uncharacterized protein n=1 Tax=Pannonibacter phragmitetus TaxID=121719 RepID=A0A0U3NC75_9HYPH|nr:hypothetical protein APZ00_25170 [Pannonibacter phragmitetus]